MVFGDGAPLAFQGVLKDSAGYKLLSSMGWKEGNGLGVNGSGMKCAIRAKRLANRQGIGVDKAKDANRKAWERSTDTYEKLLKDLKEVKADERSRPSPDKAKELKIPKPKMNKKGQFGLRYSKQKKAKSVKTYSDVDLAAILGTKPEDRNSDRQKDLPSMITVQTTLLPSNTDQQEDSLRDQKQHNSCGAKTQHLDESNQEQMYTAAQKRTSKSKQGLGTKRAKIGGGEINRGKKRIFEEEAEPAADNQTMPSMSAHRQEPVSHADLRMRKTKKKRKEKVKDL